MTTSGTGGYPPAPTDRPPVIDDTPATAPNQTPPLGEAATLQGKHVASTAADQLGNVASESASQARNLLAEAQSQVRDQASTQKDRAAGSLHTLGDELRSMSDGTAAGTQPGLATDLARQAAEKVQGLATWLEAREPGDLLDEVRGLARRKPGTFLLGAAVAGLLAGRLTRGAVEAKREDNPADGAEQPAAVTTPMRAVPTAGQSPVSAVGPEATVLDTPMTQQPDPLLLDPQATYAGSERR